MPVPVVMPHLGETVAEGTVLEWLKQEGEEVQKDEPLLAISTEKVDAEVPAPTAGVLSRILVQAGDAVPVGSRLAEIEPSAQEAGGGRREAAGGWGARGHGGVENRRTAEAQRRGGAEVQDKLPHSTDLPVAPRPPGPPAPRRFYSPAVLRLAEEFGVDLDALQGSGEGGRVTKRDVERYLNGRARDIAPAPAVPDIPHSASRIPHSEERVPLTKMRRTIADRLLRSVQAAPHATAVSEADFTAIARFRAERQEAFLRSTGVKLTFLPFVVKATAQVLRDFRLLNARWSDEAILVQHPVHLGIAVAIGEELAVPVLRAPGSMTVSEIAVRIGELVRRAKEGRLQPEEVSGSTFTVNNFGSDGTLIGTPILNPPEVGILGVGAIEKRPVVVTKDGEDVIAIRSVGYLCLSFDHRVVDGAMAGRFLQALRSTLASFRPGEGIWAGC